MAYQTIGRYRHGIWLVAKNGRAALVDRAHLPPQGSGYHYYWLGLRPDTVDVLTAARKLNVNLNIGESTDLTSQINSALRGHPATLAGPGSFLQQLLGAAAAGGVPIPGAGAGATAGDAAAGGAAGDAAAGGAGGTAAKAGLLGAAAAAITSPLDFLKFIAWIFHPRNILRAVEFLTGIALMAFGAHAALQGRGERIEGFTTSEGALTRSGLGRVARELGAAARREGGGSSGRRVRRPQAAPHTTRRTALRQRYEREQSLSRRKAQQRRKTPRTT